VGTNVPGQPRRVISCTRGVGETKRRCDEVARAGDPGFAMR
jgi:acetone monooxygenase (methyl acetate-forming)